MSSGYKSETLSILLDLIRWISYTSFRVIPGRHLEELCRTWIWIRFYFNQRKVYVSESSFLKNKDISSFKRVEYTINSIIKKHHNGFIGTESPLLKEAAKKFFS